MEPAYRSSTSRQRAPVHEYLPKHLDQHGQERWPGVDLSRSRFLWLLPRTPHARRRYPDLWSVLASMVLLECQTPLENTLDSAGRTPKARERHDLGLRKRTAETLMRPQYGKRANLRHFRSPKDNQTDPGAR